MIIYLLAAGLSITFIAACEKKLECTTCPSLINTPPVAKAGADQYLTLPVNYTELNGRQSYDIDGRIYTYRWSKIGGPSVFTIANVNASLTKVNDLVAGIYEFQLEVMDPGGLYDYDSVKVTVN